MNNLHLVQEAALGGAHMLDDARAIELDFGPFACAILHLPQGYVIFDDAGVIEVFSDFADALDWLCSRL